MTASNPRVGSSSRDRWITVLLGLPVLVVALLVAAGLMYLVGLERALQICAVVGILYLVIRSAVAAAIRSARR